MCKNCNIVKETFVSAKSNPYINLVSVHSLLSTLIKRGKLEIYAGDCLFEDMLKVLSEEKHFTVCFYLKCAKCGNFYFIGACIRGKPIYKKVEKITEENINDIIWGCEGTYFK